ncbi:uncharacterized protein LOC132919501 [Rhopalosiphum padi]|uniref:uncharacterized protein LOC132919501 n=1 Tax=Rhopalosiphum padi TaxID=40932 RepID=UPI00298E2B01|nr:uncharacterized protein LOC132919501 [Rhopalosiphum padi]
MKTTKFKILTFYVSLILLLSVGSTIVLDSIDWPEIKYNHNSELDLAANVFDESFVSDASVTTTPSEKQTTMIDTPSEWTNDDKVNLSKNSKTKMTNTRTTMTTTTSNTTTVTSTSTPTSMASLTTSALTITSATTTTGTC